MEEHGYGALVGAVVAAIGAAVELDWRLALVAAALVAAGGLLVSRG